MYQILHKYFWTPFFDVISYLLQVNPRKKTYTWYTGSRTIIRLWYTLIKRDWRIQFTTLSYRVKKKSFIEIFLYLSLSSKSYWSHCRDTIRKVPFYSTYITYWYTSIWYKLNEILMSTLFNSVKRKLLKNNYKEDLIPWRDYVFLHFVYCITCKHICDKWIF